MKASIVTLSILALCLAAAPAMADFASGVRDGRVHMEDENWTNSPYLASVTVGPLGENEVGHWFPTFCVEKNVEIFYLNRSYNATIESYAIRGGQGGGPDDPISAATEYLYSAYVDAWQAVNGPTRSEITNWMPDVTINGNDYTAAEVQNVIWNLEDEVQPLSDDEGDLKTYLLTTLGLDGDATGSVMALNLWNGAPEIGNQMQTQLVRITSGTEIPAPAAGLLVFLGLGLVGWAKRRLA